VKAIYINRYGPTDVFESGTLPKPSIGPNQILIEAHAASVNPKDCMIRGGKFQLQFLVPPFPLILGSDVSGVVAEAGAKVKRFKKGDEVFAMKDTFYWSGQGTYAEYVAVNESSAALKPSNITHEEAAGVPLCSLTAWQALVDGAGIRAGQKVLIIGASGGVGTFAVQIAKVLGAEVTGVCSTDNVDLVRQLGADRVIDYKKEKFQEVASGYDIVFDTIGKESLESCQTVLKPGGFYISTVPHPRNYIDIFITNIKSKFSKSVRRAGVVAVRPRGDELEKIAKLIEEGRMRTVIDTVFPLEDAAKAHDRSRNLRSKGKLILKVR
jgi:NADPH:quinone reductase-like Zn-dependent oxidoreductase